MRKLRMYQEARQSYINKCVYQNVESSIYQEACLSTSTNCSRYPLVVRVLMQAVGGVCGRQEWRQTVVCGRQEWRQTVVCVADRSGGRQWCVWQTGVEADSSRCREEWM